MRQGAVYPLIPSPTDPASAIYRALGTEKLDTEDLFPLGTSGPTFSRVSGQGKDIYRAAASGSGTDRTAAPRRIHDPFAWRGQQLGYARLVVVPHPVSPDFPGRRHAAGAFH